MFEDVTMNEQGRIVIPAVFRKELGLAPGEKLVVFVEDGGLRVATPMANLERLQARFRGLVPEGRSLSDELIAERRLEAAREDR